jgi:glycosyltransferase involved in cell wall biosynthesis
VSTAPRLSVVVPVRNGAPELGRSLPALEASDLSRACWELVVVDDGSTDGSVAAAERWADRVVRLAGGPHGAAFARNRGVEASRGEALAFVDADVVVHPDALKRMLQVLDGDDSVAAVFGAYDDAPDAVGFISQYRNLLHRYVHLQGAGEADTFWTGCGAVRRSAFLEAGGFDEVGFRWHIEDIDLGYRLRDRGGRILLRPEIQGTHLKRWTFRGMIRTDVLDRGVPWMRLMLRRRTHAPAATHAHARVPLDAGTLNIRWPEKVKTALVAAAPVLGVVALATGDARWLVAALAALGAAVLANLSLYGWFARRRGLLFAIGVVPLNVLYYLLNAFCAATAFALHLRDGITGRRRAERVA